jgi:hypothetical protein
MPQDFILLREPEMTLAKSCQARLSVTANKIDFEVVGGEIRGCLARDEGSALPGKIPKARGMGELVFVDVDCADE